MTSISGLGIEVVALDDFNGPYQKFIIRGCGQVREVTTSYKEIDRLREIVEAEVEKLITSAGVRAEYV